MLKKVIKKCAVTILTRRGYTPYMAAEVYDYILSDLFEYRGAGLKEKIWAYKHGFLSERSSELQLDESNCKNYLPDFSYYKLHPINGKYSSWIDDKVTLRYILGDYAEYLPKYYYELQQNIVSRLPDCPAGFHSDIPGIIRLLDKEKELAAKPVSASCGVGFCKFSATSQGYLINKKLVSKNDMEQFLSTLDHYVITEYIHPHQDIRKIYDLSPNSVRIVLLHELNKEPIILQAFFRIGTEESGMVDNLSAGGMSCDINIDNGELSRPLIFKNNVAVAQLEHPQSKVKIEGYLPLWEQVKEKIFEIADYYPQLVYMGIDVVVTDDSFKIIEINSLPDLFQLYCPVMKNEKLKEFFQKRMHLRRGEENK